ncbi:MAG: hypothetical protein P1P90_06400 [Patescibacteria group bacterium]|nr:hypothetical protein [Patescibacteria group bacterium]
MTKSLKNLKITWDKSGTKLILSLSAMGIYLTYRMSRDKLEAGLFRLVTGAGRVR